VCSRCGWVLRSAKTLITIPGPSGPQKTSGFRPSSRATGLPMAAEEERLRASGEPASPSADIRSLGPTALSPTLGAGTNELTGRASLRQLAERRAVPPPSKSKAAFRETALSRARQREVPLNE
jgi:hypothetical protein